MHRSADDLLADQRLEEVRQSEQAADFVRQEKILKLISTELTKNTTRVVEMAVKAEVQNSVLPSLENITKQEVKAALSNQIAKGVSDAMKMVRVCSTHRWLRCSLITSLRACPTRLSAFLSGPRWRTRSRARSQPVSLP